MERRSILTELQQTVTLTLIVLLAYVSAASFREEPTSTQTTTGESVTLNCAVNGDLEGVSVFWWHINSSRAVSQDSRIVPRYLSAGQISRYSIVGNVTTGEFNLQINDVTRMDIATYSCRIWDGTLWHFSRQVTLDVIRASPDCSMQVYRQLPVNVGDRVKLTCESYSTDPTVQLHWLSRGRAIESIQILSTSTLSVIQPVLTEQDYDVPFMCLETTSEKRKTCQIVPLHRQIPVIVQDRITTVFAGELASFTCTTGRAQAALSFSWFVNDMLMQETLSELTITADVVNNGSLVKCQVRDVNSGLSGENEAMLVVLTRPPKTSSPPTTSSPPATTSTIANSTTTQANKTTFNNVKSTVTMGTTVDINPKNQNVTTSKAVTLKPRSNNKARSLPTERQVLESEGGSTTAVGGEILPVTPLYEEIENPNVGISSSITNNNGFMMAFVIGSLLVGLLLIILIVLLILFLARQSKHRHFEEGEPTNNKSKFRRGHNIPLGVVTTDESIDSSIGVVDMSPRQRENYIRETNVDYAILDSRNVDDDSLSGFRMNNELLVINDDSSNIRSRNTQGDYSEEGIYLSEIMLENEPTGVSAYAISNVTSKKSGGSSAPPPAPASSRPSQRSASCKTLNRPLPAEPKNSIARNTRGNTTMPRRYAYITPVELHSDVDAPPTPPSTPVSETCTTVDRRVIDGQRGPGMIALGEEDYAEIHEMDQKSSAQRESTAPQQTTDKSELSRLKSVGELSSTPSVGSQEDSALGSGTSSEALALEECPYATIGDEQELQRQHQHHQSPITKADKYMDGDIADVSIQDIEEPEDDGKDSRQKSKMPVYARVDKSKKKKKLQKRDSKTAKEKELKTSSWQNWLENVVAGNQSQNNENAIHEVKDQHISYDNYADVSPKQQQAPAHV